MSAVHSSLPGSRQAQPFRFMRMEERDLPEVLPIEQDVYPYPWTRGNFLDSLYNHYESWVVRDADGALSGYFLLMMAVDEAHLLNITVRRDRQGQGLGIMQLDKATALAREQKMSSVLLEVRPSNQRALKVYQRYGFIQIGQRKGYYPAADNRREDAIVMRFSL